MLGGNYANNGINTDSPLIKMGNIGRGNINISKLEYIEKKINPDKANELKFGDVLLNTRNTLDLVGKVAIWKSELDKAYFNSNIMKLEFNESEISSNFYMNYILNSYNILVQMKAIATGTTSVAAIYTRDLRKILIPVPPKNEQKNIATAITNVIDLISSLEKLIAKKEAIKKGTMQLLLTGKKRLPGLKNVWQTKKISELVDIDTDNLTNSTKSDYLFNYISLEDVDYGILKNYSEQLFATAPSRARRKIRQNDILFATVRPNLKSHLFIKNRINDFICSTGFSVLRCREEVAHPVFVYQHLFAYQVESQINKLLSGSNYPSINSKDVKSLEVSIPDYETQKAIAEIFMDMDNEIFQLNEKLNKNRMIKQGLMQNLLTGKIRLV